MGVCREIRMVDGLVSTHCNMTPKNLQIILTDRFRYRHPLAYCKSDLITTVQVRSQDLLNFGAIRRIVELVVLVVARNGLKLPATKLHLTDVQQMHCSLTGLDEY